MGLMRGLDDISERTIRNPQEVDLSRPMLTLTSPHDELLDLNGALEVWTAWPIFNVRVCQFEKDQWVSASEPLKGTCTERIIEAE